MHDDVHDRVAPSADIVATKSAVLLDVRTTGSSSSALHLRRITSRVESVGLAVDRGSFGHVGVPLVLARFGLKVKQTIPLKPSRKHRSVISEIVPITIRADPSRLHPAVVIEIIPLALNELPTDRP